VSPVLTERSLEIITHSPTQTFRVGERLGRLLQSGDVVCLQGELGSGKTCLTQGIGAGLNMPGPISSPTFVFINEYQPRQPGPYLYHIDLYRIEDPIEAVALGLEDYIYGDGITVIEWAERAKDILPAERLWVTLTFLNHNKRNLRFEATGERYLRVLGSLRAELYPQRG